ncbi:MAG: proton-conducting transporter membrane subunit [Pirellulaceae bacterium]|nr:proton-conducting transporter membrane subunit [Pirellulaceae bacterium]
MNELHLPWLELAILVPTIAAIWVGRIHESSRARTASLAVAAITLFLTTACWIDFESLVTFEAHDHWDLVRAIIGRNELVIDKLNAPLLPLTTLLFFLTMLATPRVKFGKYSFSLGLLSLSSTLAVLSCRETWLLITFLAVNAIPMYVDLRSRGKSTRIFAFHIGLSLVCFIAGAVIYQYSDSEFWQGVAIVFLVTAVLIRSGCAPLHCWITDLFEHAAFGNALLFVTPLVGAYVAMRLILPIAPDWALHWIAFLSLFTALYASCMALVQTDSRRFFCYLFLSHSSLVLVGLETASPIGLTGALCVWFSVALSLTGLGLTLRCVEARTGPLSLAQYHGLYSHMPQLAGFFLLTGLSAVGFPCTIGFTGTELLVEAGIGISPLVGAVVVVSTAMNGIAILHAYFRIFTGTSHPSTIVLKTLKSERIAILTFTLLLIGAGLWPQPGVHSRFDAAVELLNHRGIAKIEIQADADPE